MNTLLRSSSQLVNPLARQRMMGFGTAAGGGVSYIPPLDAVSSKVMLAGALFRLFTGNAESTRIRESGGSTEADIGSLAAGGYDTASFTAHVGGGTGYVAKLYDQLNAADAVQGTAASQPSIDLTGMNNLPAMVFASGNRLTTGDITNSVGNGDYEIWCLFKATTLTGDRCLLTTSSLRANLYCSTTSGAGKLAFWDGSAYRVFNTALASGTMYLARLYRSSGTVYCELNGAAEASTYASAATLLNPSKIALGSESVSSSVSPYVGRMQFAAVFKEVLSAPEAAALTTALKTIGGIA